MKKKNTWNKRILSLILCGIMVLSACFGMIPGTEKEADAAVTPFGASYDGTDLSGGTTSVSLANGATAWTTPQVLKAQAGFSAGSTGRTVTLKLDAPLDFTQLPGCTRSGNNWNFNAATLPTEMQGVITGVAVTYSTKAYGSATYAYAPTAVLTISDAATSVNTNDLIKVRPTPEWLSETSNVFTNAIVVTADDSDHNPQSETLETLTVPRHPAFYTQAVTAGGLPAGDYPTGQNPYYVEAGATNKVTYFMTTRITGGGAGQFYYDKMEYVFKVPKILGLTAVNTPPSYNTSFATYGTTGTSSIDTSSDPAYDLVTVTYNNIFTWYNYSAANAMMELEFTPSTTMLYSTSYPIIQFVSGELTMPNGRVENIPATGAFSYVNGYTCERAKAASPIISVYNRTLNLQISDVDPGVSTQVLGEFDLRNDTVNTISNNQVTYEFPEPGITVRSFFTVGNATNITVTDSLSNTYTIPAKNAGESISLSGDCGVTDITRGITKIEYTIPTYIPGERSEISGYVNQTQLWGGKYYGYVTNDSLTDWVSHVTVSDGAPTPTTATADSKGHVVPSANCLVSYVGNVVWKAGDTKTLNFVIQRNGYSYNDMDSEDLTIYLREDDYLTYDTSALVLTTNGKEYKVSDGTLTVTQHTDNLGKTYYAVKPTTDDFNIRISDDTGTLLAVQPTGPRTAVLKVTAKAANTIPNAVLPNSDFFAVSSESHPEYTFVDGNYSTANTYEVDTTRSATTNICASHIHFLTFQASSDFIAGTAANLDGGTWETYDPSVPSGQLVINSAGQPAYQVNLQNNTDKYATGSIIMIPIPKKGENTNNSVVPLQTADFGFTLNMNQELTVPGCTVTYSTSYEDSTTSSGWKAWSAITDKTTIRMVKVEISSTINPHGSVDFDFDLDLPTGIADDNDAVNTYGAQFLRVVKDSPTDLVGNTLNTSTQLVSMKIQMGVISGHAWSDEDHNCTENTGDTDLSGMTVNLLDSAPTPAVIKTTTTDTNGDYEFTGLANGTYTVQFVNASPTIQGFIITGPDSDVDTAGEADVTLSATNHAVATANAGVGPLVDVTLHANDTSATFPVATTDTLVVKAVAGAPITTVTSATNYEAPTRTNYVFAGWYKEAAATTAIGTDTIPTTGTDIYAKWSGSPKTVTYVVTPHGTTSDALTETVAYGDSPTGEPTVTADTDYVLWQWSDGANTYDVGDLSNYTVIGDVTFTAVYELDKFGDVPTNPALHTPDGIPDKYQVVFKFTMDSATRGGGHYFTNPAITPGDTVQYRVLTRYADAAHTIYSTTATVDLDDGDLPVVYDSYVPSSFAVFDYWKNETDGIQLDYDDYSAPAGTYGSGGTDTYEIKMYFTPDVVGVAGGNPPFTFGGNVYNQKWCDSIADKYQLMVIYKVDNLSYGELQYTRHFAITSASTPTLAMDGMTSPYMYVANRYDSSNALSSAAADTATITTGDVPANRPEPGYMFDHWHDDTNNVDLPKFASPAGSYTGVWNATYGCYVLELTAVHSLAPSGGGSAPVAPLILTMTVPGQKGDTAIHQEEGTIAITVPKGTDLSSLIPTFTTSTGGVVTVGTVTQISGTTSNNFEKTIEYLVTSPTGQTKSYKVTITLEEEEAKVPYFTMNKTIYRGNVFYVRLSNVKSGSKVTIQNSNSKVAKATKTGKITALTAGKTTITYLIEQGGTLYKYQIKVTVKKEKGENWNLKTAQKATGELPALTVYKRVLKGATTKITISNIMSDAKVSYKSSNPKVATVSSKGVVKGVAKGKTVVTASITQNGHTYRYYILVRTDDGTYDRGVSSYLLVK